MPSPGFYKSFRSDYLMRLKDKVAIITGAGQGIGEGIAMRFAREGAKVVLVDVNESQIKQVEQNIKADSGIALAIVGDVTSQEAMKDLVEQVVKEFGTIDILINNAGITRDALLHKMSEDKWDMVINVNLKGTFNLCQAVAPIMREKGYGKIVNISSAARMGNVGQTNYSASKAGVVGLTRALCKELAPKQINVNAVAPGFIETEMSKKVPEDILKALIKNIPMLRQGTIDEIAGTCVFLASDEAAFINGQVIHVDGGRFMF
jgi:3-oxoacyl-[acyl-carrier protein] reductase